MNFSHTNFNALVFEDLEKKNNLNHFHTMKSAQRK